MPGNYGNSYKSIRVRRGIKSAIPALRDGEIGFCTDTKELAVGYSGTNSFFPTASTGVNKWSPHPTLGAAGTPNTIVPGTGLASITTETWKWYFVTGRSTHGGEAVTANPQIAAGTVIGEMLKLTGNNDTDYPIFQDGTGLKLNGPWPGMADAQLLLSWDGAAWAEEARR